MPSFFKRSPKNAVIALFVLNGGLLGVWASRIPALVEFHELGHGTLGILLLVLAAGAIISFPFSGYAADRIGAKRVCFASYVVYVLAMIALGLSPSIPMLAVALFLFGVGAGSGDVAMNTWATEVEEDIKKPIMPFFHAMFSLGAGIGVASGYLAVTFGMNYTLHFVIASIFLGAFTWFMMSIPYTFNKQSADVQAPFIQIPKGALLWVGLIAGCSAIGEGAVTDWSAILMVNLHGASEAQATFGYGAFAIAMVIVRLIGETLTTKYGSVLMTQISGVFATIGAILTIVQGPIWVSVIGFSFMGVGYALIFPYAFSRAGMDPHVSKGAAIASVATVGYGGILLGPPIIGFLAELFSLRVSFGLLAVLAFLITIFASHLKVDTSSTKQKPRA